jgi:hypothetical protein
MAMERKVGRPRTRPEGSQRVLAVDDETYQMILLEQRIRSEEERRSVSIRETVAKITEAYFAERP